VPGADDDAEDDGGPTRAPPALPTDSQSVPRKAGGANQVLLPLQWPLSLPASLPPAALLPRTLVRSPAPRTLLARRPPPAPLAAPSTPTINSGAELDDEAADEA
jgi:hypothetical protein